MKQNKIPRNEYIVKPKGKTNPYKDDVQYTNLGQWKYPGQVTKIPSNDITMQGVNYPVYGEDNLGYGQMMYPGMDYTFPGQYVTEIPMAQKGQQVEDNDSWLENIAEIIEPTGLSSWDDVYRAYQNTGLSGETAKEILGAIPLLGKVGKLAKSYNYLAKTPRQAASINRFNNAMQLGAISGRGSDAVQAALGAKDNSGFTWDMRHGEVPKYGGRNIFPQIQLGEHGDYAYGGDPSLPNIEDSGWLDEYQVGGGYHPEYYDNRLASGEKYPIVYKDNRKIPQSGVVVDKRTNMAYAVGDNGKTLSFNVMTGANPDSNINPYTVEQLAQNRKLRVTPVGYYNLEKQLTPVKGDDEDVNYKSKIRYLNPIPAYGQAAPNAANLAFHRLYADDAYNADDVEYNKRLELLRQADPKLRCGSYGCVNVGDNSYDKINKMFPNPDTLMVIDSKRPKDLKLLNQAKKRMKKEEGGEWLDSYEDEFKKGGQKGLKRFTSKNIQTSINDIMLRNETIYGPSGKRRYKPNLKYQDGGESTNWLDDI